MELTSGAHDPGALDSRLLIDPEVREALETLDPCLLAIGVRPDGIDRFRDQIRGWLPTDEDLACGGRVAVQHVLIPRGDGQPDMAAVVCRPVETHQDVRPPVVFAIHGGGMIIGDRRTDLTPMLDWVQELGVAVFSAEYRLAPEHRFPAAIDDCYTGLCWLVEHTVDLEVDATHLIVAGVSAGGGLAAGLALLARDRGGPAISHQVLICPMLDDREDAPSRSLQGVPWDPVSNATGWGALLGEAVGTSDVSPYAAAARAGSLAGLPASYLDVGSVEIFRDDVLAYAGRLAQSGVPTELHLWAGGTHGFDTMVPTAEVSQAARMAQTSYVRRALRVGEWRE